MWDETAGERGPELGEATSSWSTPTEDPNGTLPLVSGAAGPKATDKAFAAGDSRYRILGPLGEGGMGIVYRAEDTRLGRSVAIKTIPAERTADLRAKERFLNEARAASALDHPNLCTVYEIEETTAGQLYLFMPCYEGETLRDRLKRGPLPLKEAVHIAQQVARGLAKAHRQGIVHCDIKPANLMLTADGVVKILDFGIARLSGQEPPVQARPSGTPKYRSPEQARGGEIGAASDIWSLGMVLHEMVTGEPPRRDEQGRISWEELVRRLPEASRELVAILSRMLAYSPADRYQNATALLADVDRLEEPVGRVAARRHLAYLSKELPLVALWLVLVCMALLAGSLLDRKSVVPAKLVSSSESPSRTGVRANHQPIATLAAGTLQHPASPVLVQLTDFPGWTWSPSLSPDGSTILYVRAVGGRSHIFSQPTVRGATAIDLTADRMADDDDTQPSFSPDGQRIAFRSERDGGGIFIMAASGGSARRLTDFGFNPSWSPDGKEIVCGTASITRPQLRPTDSDVFRVDIATGMRRRVTKGDAAQPSWSPAGKRIAYWGVVPQSGQRLIWTVPAEGGIALPVVNDGHLNWNPVWSPDGRYLYFVSDRSGIMNLWRVPINEESGKTRGEPEPVTNSQQAIMQVTFSSAGQLAFLGDATKATLEKVDFDPAADRVAGAHNVIVESSGLIVGSSASRDGSWLVYQLLTPKEELWIVRSNGTGLRRLIGDGYRNRSPQFSVDGLRIAFYSNRSGNYEIWAIGRDDSVLVKETDVQGQLVSTPLWSPNGKMLACEVGGNEALIDLTRPLYERFPQFLQHPDSNTSFIAYSWSVNGRWLAGERQRRDGSHVPGIVLYSLAGKKYKHLTDHGQNPVWLHSGRGLLYFEHDSVFLLDIRTGRSRPVLAPPAGSIYRHLSLSFDDRALYLTRIIGEGHIWLLETD